MISFSMQDVRHVLCLGAHSDDIEIGCGGTLLHMMRKNPKLRISWVVLSGGGERTREARKSAKYFMRHSSRTRLISKQFKISYFPFEGAKIKSFFESLKRL